MAGTQDEIGALRAQVAALTARVYELEQRAGVRWEPRVEGRSEPAAQAPGMPLPGTMLTPPTTPATTPDSAGPPHPPHLSQPPPRQELQHSLPIPERLHQLPTAGAPAAAAARRNTNLEEQIGQHWLNRIGIVAILIGVSYFLKYAFENNWIGPTGRVAIGLLTGVGLVLWSELFRAKGYKAFSYSLKAVGIGALYLSLWGASQIYHLIPQSAAFVAMVIVTAATITLAITQDAEVLAAFALVGGFSTPVLLSTGQNHEVALFSYLALLDLAMLAMAIVKPWRRLLWGSFLGTGILYIGWSFEYYSISQRPTTVLFLMLFAGIFAVIPLATPYEKSRAFGEGPSVTLTLLPLFNAAAFFLALYQMYERDKLTLTWYALGLAAVYLGIASLFKRKFPTQDTKFIHLLHVAIAIAFITIAIPLKLDGQWITIGWLIESAVLLWVSVKTRTDFLRYLAVAALVLGIWRLVAFDRFHTDTLVFNARFATYLVAIAVLGGIIGFGKEYASRDEKPFLDAAVVALNLLALMALTLEASDYFDRQFRAYAHSFRGVEYAQLGIERAFSYSAIWLVYGVALMAIGFNKRSSFIRWQALVLIAATIAKVFLYDVSALDKGFRILSFVALGAVLLGISFVYQRDWLKLSSRPAGNGAEGPS